MTRKPSLHLFAKETEMDKSLPYGRIAETRDFARSLMFAEDGVVVPPGVNLNKKYKVRKSNFRVFDFESYEVVELKGRPVPGFITVVPEGYQQVKIHRDRAAFVKEEFVIYGEVKEYLEHKSGRRILVVASKDYAARIYQTKWQYLRSCRN